MVSTLVLLAVAGISAVTAQSFEDFVCPDEFEGYYPHDLSCDRFWECKEGIASLETCGNGLAFSDIDPTYTTKNCLEIYNVECGARTELEPPISAPNCPRLYGTFDAPDDCTAFYNCRDGHADRFSCAPGLAFNPEKRVCDWADQVDACKQNKEEAGEDPEVFACPGNVPVGIFSKHPHPEDCRQFFVCIAGIPREYGCPIGTVFKVGEDQFEGQCADPADVPECTNYYGDLEFDKEELVKSGVDPEAVGVEVRAQPVPRPRANRPRAEKPRANSPLIAELVEVAERRNPQPPPPPPRKASVQSVSSNSFRTRTRPQRVNSLTPVAKTTTTTTTRAPPPRVEVPALPLKSDAAKQVPNLGQPAKVKAGEDYYYYYYYYDDDEYPEEGGDKAPAAASG